MASGTLQIRSRHTESSVCLDAVRHDACETWCDHAGGSESGLRAWELDVGEWERASEAALVDAVKVQSDDEYGTDFFLRAVCSCVLVQTVPLFEQLCCNGVIRPAILEHPRPCQLEMELRMMTRGWKVDSLQEGEEKGPGTHKKQEGIGTSNTDISTCKNCGRTGHWVKGCRQTTMIQSGEAPFKTSEELPPLSGELNHALSPQGGQIPGFSPYVLSAPHLHGATH